MERGKKILVKFLIVLVTLICADNGRSFVFAGNGIEILLCHHQDKNAEESQHNHLSNLNDDEKWIQPDNQKIPVSDLTLPSYLFDSENPTVKFSDKVWQPPKLFLS